jgi:hypothetical protein
MLEVRLQLFRVAALRLLFLQESESNDCMVHYAGSRFGYLQYLRCHSMRYVPTCAFHWVAELLFSVDPAPGRAKRGQRAWPSPFADLLVLCCWVLSSRLPPTPPPPARPKFPVRHCHSLRSTRQSSIRAFSVTHRLAVLVWEEQCVRPGSRDFRASFLPPAGRYHTRSMLPPPAAYS